MDLSGTRLRLYPDIAMLGDAAAAGASKRRSPQERQLDWMTSAIYG